MKYFFTIILLISTNPLWAWGPTGHRVVGELATKYLDKKTLTSINSILGGESLARVSTWPDEIRSDPQKYGHTFKWHYSDWPDEKNEYDEKNSSGLLIQEIRNQLIILKSAQGKKEEKKVALKFLVHLIGDLHMPLHVGNGKDRGGNDCKVYFHNSLTNLHALWDEKMIAHTELSFTELSNFLFKKLSKIELASIVEGDITDWAKESKSLRQKVYPKGDQQIYCDKNKNNSDADIPKLSYEYSYQFLPMLERQLFLSAIRLSHLLEKNLVTSP